MRRDLSFAENFESNEYKMIPVPLLVCFILSTHLISGYKLAELTWADTNIYYLILSPLITTIVVFNRLNRSYWERNVCKHQYLQKLGLK